MQKLKIKKNDQVVVIAGRDKNARGKVLRVIPATGKAIVERVNLVKKHTKPNPQKQIQGGILEREAPIRLSNLKVICPECGEPARMGWKRLEDGRGVRVCKQCGATAA
ncbi:MAG TPA: 50S ribosomal protein L24 [Thermoanaerobaculia bacterium]